MGALVYVGSSHERSYLSRIVILFWSIFPSHNGLWLLTSPVGSPCGRPQTSFPVRVGPWCR